MLLKPQTKCCYQLEYPCRTRWSLVYTYLDILIKQTQNGYQDCIYHFVSTSRFHCFLPLLTPIIRPPDSDAVCSLLRAGTRVTATQLCHCNTHGQVQRHPPFGFRSWRSRLHSSPCFLGNPSSAFDTHLLFVVFFHFPPRWLTTHSCQNSYKFFFMSAWECLCSILAALPSSYP
jgi:hypothetical protein